MESVPTDNSLSATQNGEENLPVSFLEVKEKVVNLIRKMSQKLGVEIPEDEYPEIKPSPEDLGTSGYDKKNNLLYIHPDHSNSIIAYGEEIGHFLRDYLELKREGGSEIMSPFELGSVNEFFGRLGENLARLVVSNTEGLEEERNIRETNFSDLEGSLDKMMPSVETLREKFSKRLELTQEAILKIRKFPNLLAKAITVIQKSEEENSSLRVAIEESHRLLFEDPEGLNAMFEFLASSRNLGIIPFWTKDFLVFIRETEGIFSQLKEIASLRDNYDHYDFVIDRLSDFNDDARRVELSTEKDAEILASTTLEYLDMLWHFIGYGAAEFYLSENPNWPDSISDLFRLGNRDVFDTLIDTKKLNEWSNERPFFDKMEKLCTELMSLLKRIKGLGLPMPFWVEFSI